MPARVGVVGRERERLALWLALDDALESTVCVRLIAGDAGMGKSTLAGAVAARARQRGAAVLWGRSAEVGAAPAFWPWAQVLRNLAATLTDPLDVDVDPGGGAYLASLVPALRRHLGRLPDDAPVPGDHARFALFDAVTQVLTGAARRSPLVVILEDLHAADPASVHLLRYVVAHLEGVPVLLVGTYRDVEARLAPEVCDALADVAGQGLVLGLTGMSTVEIAELVAARTGVPAHDATAVALRDGTGGNPLLVDALVAAGAADAAAAVTSTPDVLSIVRRRLDLLSPPSRALLRRASVFGRAFDVREVDAMEVGDVLAAVDEALRLRLLVEVPGAAMRFGFAHVLLRDALEDELGVAERMRAHADAERAIRHAHGVSASAHAARLAHHARCGATLVPPMTTFEHLCVAGRSAFDVLAYEQAVAHLREAVEVAVPAGVAGEALAQLRLDYGRALLMTGDAVGGRAQLRTASDLAAAVGAVSLQAEAALAYAYVLVDLLVADTDVLEILESARAALPQDPTPLRARVLARLAQELAGTDADRAVALANDALAIAQATTDAGAEIAAIRAWLVLHNGPDLDLGAQDARGTRLLELGRASGDTLAVISGHGYRGMSAMQAGDVVTGRQHIDRYRAALLEPAVRSSVFSYQHTYWPALDALLRGEREVAQAAIAEIFELGWVRRQRRAALGAWAAQQALFADLFGELEMGEAVMRAGFERNPVLVGFLTGTAMFVHEQGRVDEARVMMQAALPNGPADVPRNFGWLAALPWLARAARWWDDGAHAEEVRRLLLPYSGQLAATGFGGALAAVMDTVDHGLGVCALVLGDADDAVARFTSSVALATRLEAAAFVARSQLGLALALRARDVHGDADRADVVEAEALDALRRLGLRHPSELQAESHVAPAAVASAPRVVATARARLVREGDWWTFERGGCIARLKDSVGLRHLAVLLSRPGMEFAALDLVSPTAARSRNVDRELVASPAGQGLEVLDDQARRAYRARIEELDAEVDEATANGDTERAERAKQELEFVARELATAIGMGGRARTTGSAGERARTSVTKALRRSSPQRHHPNGRLLRVSPRPRSADGMDSRLTAVGLAADVDHHVVAQPAARPWR